MNVPARRERGSSILEFTLVGIPLIFVLISTAEIARGMWNYVKLAEAVKEGARFEAVHGRGCTSGGNTCGVTVAQVAQQVANHAIGLLPAQLNVALVSRSESDLQRFRHNGRLDGFTRDDVRQLGRACDDYGERRDQRDQW